jgi:glycosyltransferase involved in cell wall biosynthesis
LPAYLEQADILLSPRTLGQNTPMKVYSYMAAGKAIVATAIRSHLQVLDASTASLVELSAESMARALERLVADESLRAAFGTAARIKVERDYSIGKYRQTLADAYRFVAAG